LDLGTVACKESESGGTSPIHASSMKVPESGGSRTMPDESKRIPLDVSRTLSEEIESTLQILA
jgi:hypothetical protein